MEGFKIIFIALTHLKLIPPQSVSLPNSSMVRTQMQLFPLKSSDSALLQCNKSYAVR